MYSGKYIFKVFRTNGKCVPMFGTFGKFCLPVKKIRRAAEEGGEEKIFCDKAGQPSGRQ